MSVVAQGRIRVWDGASLWLLDGSQQRAEIAPHAHHAIQVTITLEGQFELVAGDERTRGPVAAVAADATHIFNAQGAAAMLFLDPESRLGRTLTRAWFDGRSLAELDPGLADRFRDRLLSELRDPTDDDALLAIGQDLVAALHDGPQAVAVDGRVAAMMLFVGERIEERVSLQAAADRVFLSAERARHLFAEQTGMPFKSYVLWKRLGRAVEEYARGRSLTEAAHGAGFADSAHLSRTFRRMFGLPAASLRMTG